MNDIQALLTKETADRDEFVKEANQQIVFRNGRIAMLEELLKAQAEPSETAAPSQPEAGIPQAS